MSTGTLDRLRRFLPDEVVVALENDLLDTVGEASASIDVILNTNADDTSNPFRIRGDNVVGLTITCPDTSSAVGQFEFQVCDTETGTYASLPVPVVAKVAGQAISAFPMSVVNCGKSWGRIKFAHSSGGAVDEATVVVTVW
jgi:hypothetical protein